MNCAKCGSDGHGAGGLQCFATEDIIIDVLDPGTGRTTTYGRTLEDVRAEGPEYAMAEQMTVGEFCRRKAKRQRTPIMWAPTTADKFSEMLEVLPPAAGGRMAFLVGEPWDHDAGTGEPRYQAFWRCGNDYRIGSRPMTIREFRAELSVRKETAK